MLTLAHQLKTLVVAVQQHAIEQEAERNKQRRTCRSYRISEENRQSIVTLLKRHKRALSVLEIVDKTGIKKNTLVHHLARLVEEGRIERRKRHNFYVYGFKHDE